LTGHDAGLRDLGLGRELTFRACEVEFNAEFLRADEQDSVKVLANKRDVPYQPAKGVSG
jgi:hypothetical protein